MYLSQLHAVKSAYDLEFRQQATLAFCRTYTQKKMAQNNMQEVKMDFVRLLSQGI